MEAAGVEPQKHVFFKWLMAHEFWSKSLSHSYFLTALYPTHVVGSCRESTRVVETFWRQVGDGLETEGVGNGSQRHPCRYGGSLWDACIAR